MTARKTAAAPREPKITIRDTPPSDQLIADALKEITLPPDGKGRQITLAKPNVLAQYRLVKILGEAASNQSYVMMVMPLLFVKAIDGVPEPFPTSEAQIEALILRLDDDGLAAVMKGVQENWGAQDEEAAKGELRK